MAHSSRVSRLEHRGRAEPVVHPPFVDPILFREALIQEFNNLLEQARVLELEGLTRKPKKPSVVIGTLHNPSPLIFHDHQLIPEIRKVSDKKFMLVLKPVRHLNVYLHRFPSSYTYAHIFNLGTISGYKIQNTTSWLIDEWVRDFNVAASTAEFFLYAL